MKEDTAVSLLQTRLLTVVFYLYRICYYLLWCNHTGNGISMRRLFGIRLQGGTNRYGSFVINPYAKYFRANIMHELILDLEKETYKQVEQNEKRYFLLHMKSGQKRSPTLFGTLPGAPGFIDHPCPFPEEIPYRLMQLYSYKGDTILDPFNGSGQTTKVASHLERHYIGIDIIKEYNRLAAFQNSI